ncbi:hypothetical protein DYB25_002590 [Aphanomyces astaci]|uniref:RWD domain-containing protein n=2 Tax=Aphanomyces astaci TaxID=112090 RepID=A0A397BSI5_APHAT|nr:hypothetical protein DYB25_002590 [Aphanomyces astaci]
MTLTLPVEVQDSPLSMKVDIKLEKGLSEPQERDIRELLNQQMEENTGMAMVYTVCEAVREYLIENNREGNDKENEGKGPAKSTTGTPVTVASFNAWKAAFDLEMATKTGVKIAVGAEKRLTELSDTRRTAAVLKK